MKPFWITLLSLCLVGGLYAQDEAVNDTVYMTVNGRDVARGDISVELSQWDEPLYVDWGDGSWPTVEYPERSSETEVWLTHTYQQAGEYNIKLFLQSGNLKARLLDFDVLYQGISLEAATITAMDLNACTALKNFRLGYDRFRGKASTVDLHGCTALETLDINTVVSSLDVRGCTALQQLDCHINELTSLDVRGCTALTDLDCRWNDLASLDVHGMALTDLDCSGNDLTSLDVSGCIGLKTLYCTNNQLTSLDVSGCTSLRYLKCADNHIVSLNMSGCTSFTTVSISDNLNNPLDSLNMSGCTALRSFSSWVQLKWLDVSGCSNLVDLYFPNNQISALNLRGCASLKNLNCRNNRITSLNLRGCDSIAFVDNSYRHANAGVQMGGNPLDSLDVRDCASLERVSLPNGRLKWLGVSGNAALETLNCDTNQLTSLDVSGCPKLKYLYCRDNRLTSLDLSGTSIEYLGEERWYGSWSSTSSRISGNPLDSLDVSECKSLYSLNCTNGRLKWLNVSGDATLRYLYCDTNRLTSLDVSGLKELCNLYCANNELTAINVTGCKNLSGGDCRNNHLPLSMLAPLSVVMDKSPQVIRGIELQALSPWDLSAEMLIEGKKTDIHCDKADSYGFEADSVHLVFYKSGTYQVTLENEKVCEVVRHKWVPVPVLYEVTVRPVDFVPAPVFSEYKEVFQGYVSISCPIAKAEIYYTDDGSEPTINSALYTKAIPMDRNMTIKAIAVFDDVVSQVATYEVKIVEAPVFSMPSGAVRRGAMVAISCAEEDAKIYYKIDAGSLGNLYTEPIRIDRAMTLRAWAVKEGRKSQEVTATYTIDNTPNETALSASTLRVYAQDRTIYLSEQAGEVEVFTTSGRRVYRGVSTAIPVPRPGVYVVTAAGQKYKVGVK